MRKINILSIGNGFSADCHTYLSQIAKSMDIAMTVGNLYAKGGTVEAHYRNWIDEEEVYTYQLYLPGEKNMLAPEELALHEVVEDEEWDFITIQQATPISGIASSYSPYLGELAEYCRMMHPKAEILLHQVPAFASDCKNKDFAKYYHASQNEMYEAISVACAQAAQEAEIERIIPNGKAWQITRGTIIGDRLTVNGYHGNELGNFLSGCVFFETITGIPATDIRFTLSDFDLEVNELIKACAHSACESVI